MKKSVQLMTLHSGKPKLWEIQPNNSFFFSVKKLQVERHYGKT